MVKITPELESGAAEQSRPEEKPVIESSRRSTFLGRYKSKLSTIKFETWIAIGRDSFKDHGALYWKGYFWTIATQMMLIRLLAVLFLWCMCLFSFIRYSENTILMTMILIYFSLSLVHIYGIFDLAAVIMVYLEVTPLNMTLEEDKVNSVLKSEVSSKSPATSPVQTRTQRLIAYLVKTRLIKFIKIINLIEFINKNMTKHPSLPICCRLLVALPIRTFQAFSVSQLYQDRSYLGWFMLGLLMNCILVPALLKL